MRLSISGTFIDQALLYQPKLINSFAKLVSSGKVELLNETYYHSLAFLYSKRNSLNRFYCTEKRSGNCLSLSRGV
jgi:alpha-amylase/alpha-mannosidase (GH57 family)